MDYEKMWNDLRKYALYKVEEFRSLDREMSCYIDILKQMDEKVVSVEKEKYLNAGSVISTVDK